MLFIMSISCLITSEKIVETKGHLDRIQFNRGQMLINMKKKGHMGGASSGTPLVARMDDPFDLGIHNERWVRY
jgi:hypothetical protein